MSCFFVLYVVYCVVFDLNVWIDIFVFDDFVMCLICVVLECGMLVVVIDGCCLIEFEYVFDYL